MSYLERPGTIALLAGVGCYFLAFVTIVKAPDWLTDQSDPVVVGVDGLRRDVAPYTPAQQRGRDTYGKGICWHCHSQYVRPWNEEEKRWGPVSQTGEYAFDVPHFFGTRRVGPDLHREGGFRPDDWQFAHLFNPRFTVSRSVMPAFTWFFRDPETAASAKEAIALLDTNGDGLVSPKFGDDLSSPTPDVQKARGKLGDLDRLGVVPDRRGAEPPGDFLRYHGFVEGPDGILSDRDAAPEPTKDARELIEYVQDLGTNIGMWRRPLYVATPTRVSPFADASERPRRSAAMRVYGFLANDPARVKAADEAKAAYEKDVAAWNERYPLLSKRIEDGKALFTTNCASCHGDEGRGNGDAAPFLSPRPRDFTLGSFKWRSTEGGNLPLDGDLFRTIFRGLPGSAMPEWKSLSEDQIWLLVDFVKSLNEGDKKFNDRNAVNVIPPARVDADPRHEILRGRAVFFTVQCANCHGVEGEGDGTAWNTTTADTGALIRPRDIRPRIRDADAPELYVLLGRHLERRLGKAAWGTISAGEAWKALAPADAATATAFVRVLLGRAGRSTVLDAIGGADALKAAMGEEAYDALYGKKGFDPLERIRMAVATEKDQPAIRFRAGASETDLYRTIFTGVEGTPMKSTFTEMWKKDRTTKSEATGDLGTRELPVRWVFRDTDGAGGPNVMKLTPRVFSGDVIKYDNDRYAVPLPAEPELATVGVTTRQAKNDKGEDVPEDVLNLRIGDDWALVHYTMWLACIPPSQAGD